ncbi:MAG TPA: histidine phosphatase family protein [Anaerolineales bacterium]|nr:histidine phosphatase family protein [Anaerolineales bacterium]
MKTLLIMRHAKSSWDDASLSDHDRPLNLRGEADAPRMGVALSERDLVPDRILSSTAIRARTTAERVADNCPFDGEIALDRDLYHAGVDEFIETLQRLPEDMDCVMLVGHNPGISELVDFLTDTPEMMTTANIAVIRLPVSTWSEVDFETEGELVEVLRPKEV